MESKIINIGVVGCGRVAQHYKKIFDSGVVTGFNLVGFCDIKIDKASLLANEYNATFFSSLPNLLKNCNLDLVLILSPSGLHYEHTKIALEFGCNVLVEKPISMVPSEAEELCKLASKNNLMYGIAFQNRLNPAIIELSKAIEAKRFGKIITATIRLRWCRFQDYYDDEWHGSWSQDGGVINQQAIHHVDALNWLFGPASSVSATITNRLNDLEAEDTLVAIIKFENGSLGTIEATTAARPEDFEASLSVVGEKGMALIGGIALNKVEQWKFIEPIKEDKTVFERSSQEVETGYGLSHGPLLQKVINALRKGQITPPISAVDAIKTTKFVHALYRSDEIKGWVKLKDNPISKRLGK